MSDGLCGYVKETDGEPCKLPASREDGRCHHHSEVSDDDSGGRPSKLEDAWDDVMAAAEDGLTLEGIARTAGIGVSTLREWRTENDDFSAELRRARSRGERELVRNANAEFILERSYGYTKEQEIEHTGDGLDLSLSTGEKELLDDLFDRDVATDTDTDTDA